MLEDISQEINVRVDSRAMDRRTEISGIRLLQYSYLFKLHLISLFVKAFEMLLRIPVE